MTATTTIRVERDVHERLVRISQNTGQQLVGVIRLATEALERSQFAETVKRELGVLKDDPDAWDDYVAGFDVAIQDGIA
jgi:hypothetical protein